MSLLRLVLGGLLAVGSLAVTPTLMAYDRESSANATWHTVSESSGVMIKVPIDRKGREQSDLAEMRVVRENHANGISANGLPKLWNESVAMNTATAAPHEASTSREASTWWGWNNWYGYGWRPAYYYGNYYTPYFNYYGNYYNYYGSYYNYYPYNYTYYYPYNNYWGYRYYYYPRYYY